MDSASGPVRTLARPGALAPGSGPASSHSCRSPEQGTLSRPWSPGSPPCSSQHGGRPPPAGLATSPRPALFPRMRLVCSDTQQLAPFVGPAQGRAPPELGLGVRSARQSLWLHTAARRALVAAPGAVKKVARPRLPPCQLACVVASPLAPGASSVSGVEDSGTLAACRRPLTLSQPRKQEGGGGRPVPAFTPAEPPGVGSWPQRSRPESADHLPRPPRAGASSGRLCRPQCGRRSLGDRPLRARCVQAPAP